MWVYNTKVFLSLIESQFCFISLSCKVFLIRFSINEKVQNKSNIVMYNNCKFYNYRHIMGVLELLCSEALIYKETPIANLHDSSGFVIPGKFKGPIEF